MRSKVGSDGGGDDVIWATHQDAHAGKHGEERDRTQGLRIDGKDGQEDHQRSHESTNDGSAASSKDIRDISNNNSTWHHTNGIKGGDKVRSDRIELLSKKVRQPEEEDVVCELEETECDCVLGNHRNAKSSTVGDRGWPFIGFGSESLLCHFLALEFEFLETSLDFGCDDTDFGRIRNELNGQETPRNVESSGDKDGPPVWETNTEDPSSTESSSDVSAVLMTSPETKNEATVFDRSSITKPVAHDSSPDLLETMEHVSSSVGSHEERDTWRQ